MRVKRSSVFIGERFAIVCTLLLQLMCDCTDGRVKINRFENLWAHRMNAEPAVHTKEVQVVHSCVMMWLSKSALSERRILLPNHWQAHVGRRFTFSSVGAPHVFIPTSLCVWYVKSKEAQHASIMLLFRDYNPWSSPKNVSLRKATMMTSLCTKLWPLRKLTSGELVSGWRFDYL